MAIETRRYHTLADRIMRSSAGRVDRAIARIALQRARDPFGNVSTLRARPGASAFERADAAILRRQILTRAERILARASYASRLHGEIFRASEALYGNHGSFISGVGREHFPSNVKDRMRRLAHTASASGFAYALIRACGRGTTYYAKLRAGHAFGFYG